MNLPNADLAVVDRQKITDYLLNSAHPDNGGKARFFADMGFTVEDWTVLADALRQHALHTPITRHVTSVHGDKYVLDGPMVSPHAKMAEVRTVWIVDRLTQTPRLVTAYPYE